MPLDKLKLAGAMDGGLRETPLEGRSIARRSPASTLRGQRASPEPAGDQLALAGIVRGSYELSSGLLDLRPLQLSSSATRVEASGLIGSRTASLNLALATSKPGRTSTMFLTAFEPAAGATVELAGQITFNGMINGSLRDPEIAGRLQASQFTYLFAPAQSPAGPPLQSRPIHVDSLSGDVSYSRTNAALHHAVR